MPYIVVFLVLFFTYIPIINVLDITPGVTWQPYSNGGQTLFSLFWQKLASFPGIDFFCYNKSALFEESAMW